MIPKEFQEILKKQHDFGDFFIQAHHVFMIKYGWIPVEEFKKIPIPMFDDLLEQIENDAKEEKKAYEKMKLRRRR